MTDSVLIVANGVTTLAYFGLTVQLYYFVRSSQIVRLLGGFQKSENYAKRNLFTMVLALAGLFAAFIALCGITHAFNVFSVAFPASYVLHIWQKIFLVLCAAVSMATAAVGYWVFPKILDVLSKFELNDEGDLQHIENYMTDVMNLVNESAILLSENFTVLRCNEASKYLFGSLSLLNSKLTDFIHPEDVRTFEQAVLQQFSGYSNVPVTIEYRVRVSELGVTTPTVKLNGHAHTLAGSRAASAAKVYATAENLGAPHTTHASFDTVIAGAAPAIPNALLLDTPEYVWVESTICKGMRLDPQHNFEYDVKMITRNIDERKRQAETQYLNILRETEEQKHINAAKLRYISCIAHDLKTPLQSFCFSMDLLQQTPLTYEQKDYVQQANVAVDLMKLTISQTMDISKALSGGKLAPRRATVFLNSVIERVKIIINGYGKQVPVSFEVASDIYNAIITDEEWLWQMLLNLLTNACKYTDKGSIQVQVHLAAETVLPTDAGRFIQFEVIDTGVGVSEEKLPTLFDAFSQVQDGQVTGTGLGLFGVRTRAEGLGGICGARANTASATGTGTVIWFALPYRPDRTFRDVTRSSMLFTAPIHLPLAGDASPQVISRQDSMILSARSSGGMFADLRLSAMVVDDTLTVRKLMEKLLLRMGFARVDCYENGSKGLDAMMAGQVDIVFSDVQMPIMTGPEMVMRFRKYEADLLFSGARTERQVVVAVTANGEQGGFVGQHGFDEVCLKPLNKSDIYHAVSRYLQGGQ